MDQRLKLNIRERAELAGKYLAAATDSRNDDLPYWYLSIAERPPYARHCRVDDAELVGSWGEAMLYIRAVTGSLSNDQERILSNWTDILLKGFRESGLRYNLNYPWTQTIFCNFHEQGWVLSALVARYAFSSDPKIKKQTDSLVDGLRKTAFERKEKTYWGGTYPQDIKSYYFLQDSLYENGWDHEKWSGRGENEMRNNVMIDPLMDWYLLTGNETALDLAGGLINNTIYESRRVMHDGRFVGHVHSAMWLTTGAVKFALATENFELLGKCRQILERMIEASSSFGWVPEYAGWHDPADEHCETCCIKDMIECALQFARNGYPEYYDLVDRYVRNQLMENQITDSSFVEEDSSRPDEADRTYRNISNMVLGGFSGGAEPNDISLGRFRNIAGCCGATGPEALYLYWKHTAVRSADNRVMVNFLHDFENDDVSLTTDYPLAGRVEIKARKSSDLLVRLPGFCDGRVRIERGGKPCPVLWEEGCVFLAKAEPSENIALEFHVPETERKEVVMGREFRSRWLGNTVMRMAPEGVDYPLYVRTGKRKAPHNVALRATR